MGHHICRYCKLFSFHPPATADTMSSQPQHVSSNAHTLIASSKQMVHTYLRNPLTNLRLLKKAFATLAPVRTQIRRSFYIFILNLPYPLASYFVRMGDSWWLRLIASIEGRPPTGKQESLDAKEAAERLARCSGPGDEQLNSSEAGDMHYPSSVQRRTADHGMSQKIRLYREGLASHPWEKSIETVVALSELPNNHARSGSGAGLFEDGPPGALRAPTTFVYAKKDFAFDTRLALDGIADYLPRHSHAVVLDKSGHWLPSEDRKSTRLNSSHWE